MLHNTGTNAQAALCNDVARADGKVAVVNSPEVDATFLSYRLVPASALPRRYWASPGNVLRPTILGTLHRVERCRSTIGANGKDRSRADLRLDGWLPLF